MLSLAPSQAGGGAGRSQECGGEEPALLWLPELPDAGLCSARAEIQADFLWLPDAYSKVNPGLWQQLRLPEALRPVSKTMLG